MGPARGAEALQDLSPMSSGMRTRRPRTREEGEEGEEEEKEEGENEEGKWFTDGGTAVE